jgi:NAD+ kinase
MLLTLDGQVTESLEPLDRIFITRSPKDVLLIASDRRGFYNALRTKLNWSGGSLAVPETMEGAAPEEAAHA